MLGRMLVHVLNKKNQEVVTAARTNADFQIDLLEDVEKLVTFIRKEQPDVVINTAAIINLLECENNPEQAYLINSRLPALLADVCDKSNSYYIQISTDHYYVGGNKNVHNEDDSVQLLNEYARTKYIGEILTNIHKKTLIVRTNIVGFKGQKGKPTFIEWILNSLEENRKIPAFTDFYTSSIDVERFSEILYELILKQITGVVNIATSDVVSKYEFITEIAEKLGKKHLVYEETLQNLRQEVERADSLGLDIQKLAKLLGKDIIPTSNEVIDWVIKRYKEGVLYELSK
jgi:dTDP-4-dehydrorhamnose reductase